VAHELFFYFGPGTYALLLCASGILVAWVIRGRVRLLPQRILGTVLLVAVTAGAAFLLGSSGAARLPIESGGILGVGLGRFLKDNFHWAGSALILCYGLIVGLLFAGDGLVTRVPALLRRAGLAPGALLAGAGAATFRGVVGSIRTVGRQDQRLPGEPKVNPGRPGPGDKEKQAAGEAAAAGEVAGGQAELFGERGAGQATSASPADAKTDRRASKDVQSKPQMEQSEAEDDSELDEPRPKAADSSVVTRPYPAELAAWEYPPITLLDEPQYQYSLEQEDRVRAQARVLEDSLDEYRIDANVVEIDTGPVITMFELRVGPGVKVSQIASLANDIARALKAPSVRVVAPIPGKNTIGIEVPNTNKEKVGLRELVTLAGNKYKDMILPLFLGKDASGNPLVGDLGKMPHLLIAGTTGSGKSVCINSLLASMLLTQRPDQAKLILVDPKMVELSGFGDIPHLMCPIVTEVSRAEAILEWAVTKMEERYELLAEAGVRNVAAFNRLSKEEIYDRFSPTSAEERACIPTNIPYVVIVIDELADLMMTSAKEVEHCLARLAQKSRAVGIHIIVATQRPEARIVTGLIKSNMPCRIAFRVSSRMDSRIVLDQNGAEVLMGQGDMLFLPPGQSKLVRAQGTLVEEHELHKLLEFVRRRGRPDYHPELVKLQRADRPSTTERDELFDEAVKIILESRRGSVSLLQRRLTIGYSRASRLIDQMADAGIVGDYKGSQAREVLLTDEEWEAIRNNRDSEEALDHEEIEEQGDDQAATYPADAGSAAVDEAEAAGDYGRGQDRVGEAEEEPDEEADEDEEEDEYDESDEDLEVPSPADSFEYDEPDDHR
jgi:S-DNA-T family DNA segregation ATPase FtsK/SpoIIIE